MFHERTCRRTASKQMGSAGSPASIPSAPPHTPLIHKGFKWQLKNKTPLLVCPVSATSLACFLCVCVCVFAVCHAGPRLALAAPLGGLRVMRRGREGVAAFKKTGLWWETVPLCFSLVRYRTRLPAAAAASIFLFWILTRALHIPPPSLPLLGSTGSRKVKVVLLRVGAPGRFSISGFQRQET